MIELRELHSVDEVQAAEWNALHGTTCPFLRHEFLAALEHTGCVGRRTGWIPAHVAAFERGQLVAAAPAYRKSHSWGEFVFDFGWAQAYERHGLAYYPKLLCAVPFSPINSPRLLFTPGHEQLRAVLVQELQQRCAHESLSSAHALFIDAGEREAFEAQGWLLRHDVQFHWRNPGYASFDQFLETFKADKRKKVKRERRRCEEAGITFETLTGGQLTPELLQFVHHVHARTFLQHGHEPYLNLAFFTELATTLGDALMVKLARHAGRAVAAAVFLWSPTTLFGRYWGALDEFHSLHFEACYHHARVKTILKRVNASAIKGEIILAGNLKIDLGQHTVTLDGRAIELTPTEFQILVTLASNPKRVFSRLQIMEHAQGDAFEGYERTIDAHIKNLRIKLEPDPKNPVYIQTVFGLGYKFDVVE